MPQTAQIEVSVLGVPEVLKLAWAARDVVDHEATIQLDAPMTDLLTRDLALVPRRDLRQLSKMVRHFMPGAEVE